MVIIVLDLAHLAVLHFLFLFFYKLLFLLLILSLKVLEFFCGASADNGSMFSLTPDKVNVGMVIEEFQVERLHRYKPKSAAKLCNLLFFLLFTFFRRFFYFISQKVVSNIALLMYKTKMTDFCVKKQLALLAFTKLNCSRSLQGRT